MPNIKFIHFNDLLNDLHGTVHEIADFLEIEIPPEDAAALVDSLTFASMKKEASDPSKTLVPLGGAIFKGGGDAFINKGTNGRWKGVLSEEQLLQYDRVVQDKLNPECAAWLAEGRRSGVEP
eukprot:TRINITY_DN18351_c0_g2_i1.p3 TRINITY_DN18351_c0_g2~~TRINITY_DN18351_c0_g2_i1.p3  ORF type:complete len:122 (-),score=34.23 TRINITY_DN18351_c0_g2_i1:89-454(-)